jgi:hypothetical protein
MKFLFPCVLVLLCVVNGQQAVQQKSLNASELGKYLLSLQPKSLGVSEYTLVVIAPFLPSGFVSNFDALAHGWCENPGLIPLCNPSHFPITVNILTGERGKESFRVPATWKTIAIPFVLSGNAATVYVVRDNPSQAIWLVRSSRPENEAIVMGGLLNGTGDTAQLIQGPGIASTMYQQMLLGEVIARATRWQP